MPIALETSKKPDIAEKVAPDDTLSKTAKPSLKDTLQSYSQKMSGILIALVSLSLGIVLWHIVTEINLDLYINFSNVPSPLKVFLAFVEHVQTSIFWKHIEVSMRRILISYSLAVVLGILIWIIVTIS